MKRRRKKGFTIPGRQLLLIITAVCFILIGLSFFTETSFAPLRFFANITVVPMEKGLNAIGTWMSDQADNLRTMNDLKAENDTLKSQVDDLTLENDRLRQDRYELNRLQELYKLDQNYEQYNKVGARVISKDSGNWFNQFVIDKGSDDGIAVDMNVIAGDGLVGIVTQVGPDWSTVRSIIDDSSNVSAMTLSTSDLCIVAGDLTQMNEGTIKFKDMENNDNAVKVGETIVTSYVSSKFLSGLVIGYVSEIKVDSNNLTRSGLITPVVDFKHLQEVLVITDLKQTQ